MRQIKFRAWVRCGEWDAEGEKQAFQMVGEDAFAFEEYAPLSELLVDIPDQQYIMQFTGLKDKNGKEIYEGDILKSDEGTGPVVIDHGSTWVKYEQYRSNLDVDLSRGTQLEVIGNIHENKNLLAALPHKDKEKK